jgi:hypothetical protein
VSMKIVETKRLNLLVKLSKPVPELTDLAAERIWKMDGVEEVSVAIDLAPKSIDRCITEFNELYKLPAPQIPGTLMGKQEAVTRIMSFIKTVSDEIREGEEIMDRVEEGKYESPMDFLVDMADWLCDIQIYCRSELRKLGINSDDVLRIIMSSNMSKLGADGKPIYDEHGKVLKGPNYWKPEPMIRQYLTATIRQGGEQDADDAS